MNGDRHRNPGSPGPRNLRKRPRESVRSAGRGATDSRNDLRMTSRVATDPAAGSGKRKISMSLKTDDPSGGAAVGENPPTSAD
jgi:hypothetical protein